jgi:hypothetical protein
MTSGANDDFDFNPKTDCLRMSLAFPAMASQLTVRMVEGAVHAFDWPRPHPTADSPLARAQTGGVVTMRYSAKAAKAAKAPEFAQNSLKRNGSSAS